MNSFAYVSVFVETMRIRANQFKQRFEASLEAARHAGALNAQLRGRGLPCRGG